MLSRYCDWWTTALSAARLWNMVSIYHACAAGDEGDEGGNPTPQPAAPSGNNNGDEGNEGDEGDEGAGPTPPAPDDANNGDEGVLPLHVLCWVVALVPCCWRI